MSRKLSSWLENFHGKLCKRIKVVSLSSNKIIENQFHYSWQKIDFSKLFVGKKNLWELSSSPSRNRIRTSTTNFRELKGVTSYRQINLREWWQTFVGWNSSTSSRMKLADRSRKFRGKVEFLEKNLWVSKLLRDKLFRRLNTREWRTSSSTGNFEWVRTFWLAKNFSNDDKLLRDKSFRKLRVHRKSCGKLIPLFVTNLSRMKNLWQTFYSNNFRQRQICERQTSSPNFFVSGRFENCIKFRGGKLILLFVSDNFDNGNLQVG